MEEYINNKAFNMIYSEVVDLWGITTIDISDGIPSGKSGMYFEKLSTLRFSVIDSVSNNLQDVLAFEIFKELHRLAKAQLITGNSIVHFSDIDKTNVKTGFFSCILSEGNETWREDFYRLYVAPFG
jgi:hypothetical protein